MYSYGLKPLILRPTRVCRTTATLIDHMWYRGAAHTATAGVIISDVSDHFVTFVQVDNCTDNTCDDYVTIKKRYFNELAWHNYLTDLRDINFHDIALVDGVNIKYNYLTSHMLELYDLHFPIVTRAFKKNLRINRTLLTN